MLDRTRKSNAGLAGRDRAAVLSDGFTRTAMVSLEFIAIAVAAVLLGLIVQRAWVVLLPVTLALIVSTLLAPPASYLRRHGWPDALAALTVVVASLTLVVGGLALLAPTLGGQFADIAERASGGLEEISTWLTDGPLGLSDGQLDQAIEAAQDRLQSSASTIGSSVFSTLAAATSMLVNLVIVIMLTFFFIKDGYKFLPWLNGMAGQRFGTHLATVCGRCWATLGGFIRTQALVSLIDAVLIGAGLLILDVPLALPLALVTFVGGFIPIVGAFISGALAVLVTLVTNEPRDVLIVIALILAVQQLEGNVLSPWLQGKAMNLHAAVVLLAVTGGGSLFGITGAFLAVPVVATLAELIRYVNEQVDAAVALDPMAPDPVAPDPMAPDPRAKDPVAPGPVVGTASGSPHVPAETEQREIG